MKHAFVNAVKQDRMNIEERKFTNTVTTNLYEFYCLPEIKKLVEESLNLKSMLENFYKKHCLNTSKLATISLIMVARDIVVYPVAQTLQP